MFLHKEDRELFKDIITIVSEKSGLEESIIEKDYYVSIILKELADRNNNVVFKGGTSLSKAYHVIDRFSEDIDITFDQRLGEARRKKVKYQLLQPISELLELPIDNWNTIESDKDYNHYDFLYKSVINEDRSGLRPFVKLETALMSYAYPTEEKEITSFIYDYLVEDEPEIINEFGLVPFSMKVQSLSRTFIDKLFAVCDYFMINKPIRNSRHLYDIYKMKDQISFDETFACLVKEVRQHRAKMNVKVAPSARENINVYELAEQIVLQNFYAVDYRESTMKLITENNITYEMVKNNFIEIMSILFKD